MTEPAEITHPAIRSWIEREGIDHTDSGHLHRCIHCGDLIECESALCNTTKTVTPERTYTFAELRENLCGPCSDVMNRNFSRTYE
jgi:hypothetical protein